MKCKVIHSLSEVSSEQWDALSHGDFIFSRHAFLMAMENSGSLGERTGWYPHYLIIEGNDKKLIGACPLYLKLNSYGEYIFDWAWAEFSERIGQRYYPKLTAAIPFTPATGAKLLVHHTENIKEIKKHLISAAMTVMKDIGASSLHYLFTPEDECEDFSNASFMRRHTFQYHWRNRDYSDFSDFLGNLKQKRRKEIKRERNSIATQGLKIEVLQGDDIKEEHAELMIELYQDTIASKYAYDYLTPDFFREIFQSMKDSIVFVIAKDSCGPFAGTLNFEKGNHLYGRYWGSLRPYRNLHFELCYYRTIEYAIERKIRLFEAGAQGEHKVSRGFSPSLTYSTHHIVNETMRDAVGRVIEEEKQSLEKYFEQVEDAYQ